MIYLGKQAVGSNSMSTLNGAAPGNALVYMGTIGSNGDFVDLPVQHNIGDFYKIITSGTYAGQPCLAGDYIFCISNGTVVNNNDWSILRNRVLINPISTVTNNLVSFGDSSGTILKDSGFGVTTQIAAGNNNLVTSEAVYNALLNNYSFVLNGEILEINYVGGGN